MSSQGPQGGFSSQNGSPFNSMTAGTAGTSPLAQAPPGWGAAQGASQQQGMPQQSPPRGPTRKETAAVHDPFAALTGEQCWLEPLSDRKFCCCLLVLQAFPNSTLRVAHLTTVSESCPTSAETC